jgi:hypothetical protein
VLDRATGGVLAGGLFGAEECVKRSEIAIVTLDFQ